MEYITVFINYDSFKLPVSHKRLKKLVREKYNIDDNDVEKLVDLDDHLVLRKTTSPHLNVIKNRTNIFVLNFYLGLLKTNGKIELNSFIDSSNDNLLDEIRELIKIPLTYEELIAIMNNHEEITNLSKKYKQKKIKKNSSGGFSITKLRENQRIKNEE